jgi:hypothetical protein
MWGLLSGTIYTHTPEHTSHRGKKEVKAAAAVVEKTYLGPRVREGEQVFGVAHIYASFNDTFVVCCPIHPPPHPTVSQLLSLSSPLLSSPHRRSPLSHPQHVTDLSGKETICRITGA